MKPTKTTTPLIKKFDFLLITLALAWFALSQTAQAQDGDELNGNTAEGLNALHTYITTASSATLDTAIGDGALASDTTGSSNTATGASALVNNTTGNNNTANGVFALLNNTTGSFNTANGISALLNNTTASNNTATGAAALEGNTIGSANTANGASALQSNTTGDFNTANGASALQSNTTGGGNTATGVNALFINTIGSLNTATGGSALKSNTSGSFNTATGVNALVSNTTGASNAAIGYEALGSNTTGSNNTANGVGALNSNTTGKSNIALGFNAGFNLTIGNNNIDIGNVGVAGESSHIRIGTKGTQTNTFIAGIHGVTVASAVGVVVDVNGHLGTVTSSARFKDDIKPMDKASEAILALKPVTFRYKKELDPEGIPQFGLVAEQVEKVNPDLVARDADGKLNTVRYEAVNAMLLNEFLKEHRKVQRLEAALAAVNGRLKAQDAKIDKVNAKVQLTKPAPQMVADNGRSSR